MKARKPLIRVLLGTVVILFSLTMFGAYLYRTKERAEANKIQEARRLEGATKSWPGVRPGDLQKEQTTTTLSHGPSPTTLEFHGSVSSKSSTAVFSPGDIQLPSETKPDASPSSTPIFTILPAGKTIPITSKSGFPIFSPEEIKLQPGPTPPINYGPELNPAITSKSLSPIFSPQDVSPQRAATPVPTPAP